MKRLLVMLLAILMLGSLVGCGGNTASGNGTQQNTENNTEKSYETEVKEFVEDVIKVMNSKKYEDCFEYVSKGYRDVIAQRLNIGVTEMKSNLRKSFTNLKASNFRLASLEVVTFGDKYMVYAATLGYDCNNGANYEEYIMYIFKEGDKIVYAENIQPYNAMQISEEKYDYSSPIVGYSFPEKEGN